MTLTVDLIESGAPDLLRDMERLNLIRLNPPEKTTPPPEGRLSERFDGALHLSAEKHAEFQTPLRPSRIGFLKGRVSVPADFDTMGQKEYPCLPPMKRLPGIQAK